jgi:hypothetical protein
MEIVIAVIGGFCTLLAAFVGPLLSRRRRRQNSLALIKRELEKLPESPEVLILKQAILNVDEQNESDVLWKEFLADTSDEHLEAYLFRIDSVIEKHPKEVSIYALKELVQTAIRARNRNRSKDFTFTKLLASISSQFRKLLSRGCSTRKRVRPRLLQFFKQEKASRLFRLTENRKISSLCPQLPN